MVDRLPGKYDSKIHSRVWLHSGKIPTTKYNFSESGLAPESQLILPPSHRTRKTTSPDNVREFMLVREGEAIISIEHCADCESHSLTTHHLSGMYKQKALRLRNRLMDRLPMLKILIKPCTALERIGAFEIQFCSKIDGNLNKTRLFSKIASKSWPKAEDLIRKIQEMLPKCNLTVNLFDEKSSGVGGLLVKLIAHKERTDRPPSSKRVRPLSSVRNKPSKINKPAAKTNREGNPILEKYSNAEGTVYFHQIPIDKYSIEVTGDSDLCADETEFCIENLFSFNYSINILVKPNPYCFLKITLRNPKTGLNTSKLTPVLQNIEGEFKLIETHTGVYEGKIPKNKYTLIIGNALQREINCLQNQVFVIEYITDNIENTNSSGRSSNLTIENLINSTQRNLTSRRNSEKFHHLNNKKAQKTVLRIPIFEPIRIHTIEKHVKDNSDFQQYPGKTNLIPATETELVKESKPIRQQLKSEKHSVKIPILAIPVPNQPSETEAQSLKNMRPEPDDYTPSSSSPPAIETIPVDKNLQPYNQPDQKKQSGLDSVESHPHTENSKQAETENVGEETKNVEEETENVEEETKKVEEETKKKTIQELDVICTETHSLVSSNTSTLSREALLARIQSCMKQITANVFYIQQSIATKKEDFRFFFDWLAILKSLQARLTIN